MSFKSPLRGFPTFRAAREAAMGSADAFVGAYDAIPNLVHIYEPGRRTLAAYTGNLVRLRRASDNAEANFTYNADGDLDTAAIAAWLGGAAGYVVTVYDQVGSDDITYATDANQFTYIANAKNGHAGMQGNGSARGILQGAFTISGALSQPFSVYAVAQLDATAVNDGLAHLLCDGDDALNRIRLMQFQTPNPDAWLMIVGSNLQGGNSDSNWNIWSGFANGLTSQFWLNGVSEAGPGDAGAQNPDGLTVGARLDGATFWKGPIVSFIIADPSHSAAQRGAMETAINNYWAVY